MLPPPGRAASWKLRRETLPASPQMARSCLSDQALDAAHRASFNGRAKWRDDSKRAAVSTRG